MGAVRFLGEEEVTLAKIYKLVGRNEDKVNKNDPVFSSGDDRAMIERPDLWVQRPLLPMKKRKQDGGFPQLQLGCLIEGRGPRLWNIDPFSASSPLGTPAPVAEYDSFDALIADGWVAD